MKQKNINGYKGERKIENQILLKIAEILRQEHFLTAEEQMLFNQQIQKA